MLTTSLLESIQARLHRIVARYPFPESDREQLLEEILGEFEDALCTLDSSLSSSSPSPLTATCEAEGLEPDAFPVRNRTPGPFAVSMERLPLDSVYDSAGSTLTGDLERADVPPAGFGFLERYEDQGPIGIGGMGEVRRVVDRDLNRTMAMKIIKRELLRKPTAVARFIEEAQATAQLQHPGIVPVHELGKLADGRYYFTMKEVRGRTLKAAIDEVHRASPGSHWQAGPSADVQPDGSGSIWTFRRLIDAFGKVCDAMAYAHARGVVHRDLKPTNLMVGDYGEVLVVDWGLARVMGQVDRPVEAGELEPVDTDRAGLSFLATRLGAVGGTPAYMSPEQARGEADRLGPASDVYALGAVLYEILSGCPPYEGADGRAVLHQVLTGPPGPPGRRRVLNETPTLSVSESSGRREWEAGADRQRGEVLEGPPLPEELVRICLRAMARDVEQRYPDAGMLGVEVRTWLDDARRRERALQVVEVAEKLPAQIAQLRARIETLRLEASDLLAGIGSHEPVEKKLPGWDKEDEATRLEREADLKHVDYRQTLRGALTHQPDLPEAHAKLAAYYRAQHAEAEGNRDERTAARAEQLLRAYDRTGHYTAYLEGAGAVTLLTEPSRAEVALYRYEVFQRRLVPKFERLLGRTPLREVRLAKGSYLLKLTAPGRAEVRYPVHIGRGEHWDGVPPEGGGPQPVYLPESGALGPEDIYVPAGWFLSGGDPEAYTTLPRRRLWVDGLVVRKFPVTNREYLAFLNDLVSRGREEDALRWVPRAPSGTVDELGAMLYGRTEEGQFVLRPDAEGDIWLPDYPVTMVDWHCAMAYAGWEQARGGGAWRLPLEMEWEKAARGVDGRSFPWGDFVDPSWALLMGSHAGRPLPAVVDSFPLDESPYGVRGLGGNVRDWCMDVFRPEGPVIQGARVRFDPAEEHEPGPMRPIRGGGWVNVPRLARIVNRSGYEMSFHVNYFGFRLLRSPVP